MTASRGNNLHEVETAEQQKYLVSMPTKFRKNVWIKRGIIYFMLLLIYICTFFILMHFNYYLLLCFF